MDTFVQEAMRESAMLHFEEVLEGFLEPSVGSNPHQSASRVFQKTVVFIGTFGMRDFAWLIPHPSWSWSRFDVMCKDLDQGLHALNLLFFGNIDFTFVSLPFVASREGKNSSIGGDQNRQQSTMTRRWKIEKCENEKCVFSGRISEKSSPPLEGRAAGSRHFGCQISTTSNTWLRSKC